MENKHLDARASSSGWKMHGIYRYSWARQVAWVMLSCIDYLSQQHRDPNNSLNSAMLSTLPTGWPSHESKSPHLAPRPQMPKSKLDCEVAIVGFGPTGAVAAALLGACGIQTRVFESTHTIYDKPRAFALDHEIIRLFQQLGLYHAVSAHLEPFTDSVYYGVDGQVIRRMSTVAPPYPLGHFPSVVFTQPVVESILRAHVQTLPCVGVSLGQTLTQLRQDEHGVTLHLQGDDGHTHTLRAGHVLGCDGASSAVRAQTGMELMDLGFDQPWLVVDALVNEQALSKLPNTSAQYCHPDRPSTYLIGPGRHRRWEISINPGEDPQEMCQPDRVWSLLAPWLSPADGTLWRQASYRFHALVAKSWRQGRVFIAGDAAHQQPPFLGQGLCQGLRDVSNLSWKLHAVLRAGAPDALLETYAQERQAHVTDLTTRIKDIGQLIGERDLMRARTRDARLLAAVHGQVQATPRQDVQPALRAGLLAHQNSSARGTLFPQPWLANPHGPSRLMDDVLGCGWRLVLGPAADAAWGKQAIGMTRGGLTVVQWGRAGFVETEGVLQRWFERHDCQAALVRPDHYVYGTAQDASGVATWFDELSRFSTPNRGFKPRRSSA